MDPCVNCGTVEPVVPVPSCDCQTLNPCGGDARETRLLAPTRHEHDKWAANNPILSEGVLGLVKDRLFEGSVEYIIGDGEHTYSELLEMYRIYAGAPLSRTGAVNHSPLAASGKSTLDPSWLPAATSNALGAVMVSTTGAAGKVPIPASGSSTLDPSWLPVSTSGAADKIPIADDNGKLDPSWLPEATNTTLGGVKASTTKAGDNVVKADANGGLGGWKDAISDAVANPSAGLVKNSDGTLGVDFNQMPTDKFEDLLKSLKMLVPLEANLNLYVDKNHSAAADSIIDGRGSEAMPFKTIQACVNYVTQNYAIGTHVVTIYVKQAIYNESVRLPQFSRTSGYINLRAYDYSAPPTISVTDITTDGINVSGSGDWVITRFNVNASWTDNNDGTSKFPSGISVSSGASLTLYGCSVSVEYVGAAPSAYSRVQALTINSDANLYLSIMETYNNAFSCVKGNAQAAYVIFAQSGHININDSYVTDSGSNYNIVCDGTVTATIGASVSSTVANLRAGGNHVHFTGSVTGKRYEVDTGSNIIAPIGGFPGTESGTVQTSTYSWYDGDTGEE